MTTTPLTDALIDSAHITHGKVAAQMRVLETENRRLIDLLDSACAAAGMLPMEPGRYQLLADKVADMRADLVGLALTLGQP